MKYKIVIIFIVIILIFFIGMKFTGMVVSDNNTCSDSDFGINYYSFGEVRGETSFFSKEQYKFKDKCLDGKTLLEYFCSSDGGEQLYRSSKKYKCLDGCSGGKCLGDRRTGVEEPEVCEGLIWCKVKGWFF